jgi:hypothetical protein
MDLLRYIRLGIQYREFFSYDSYQITLRPITSQELDDTTTKALEIADARLCDTLMKIRIGIFKATEDLKNIPPELMLNFKMYRDETDYWTVYYSMKDFMPTDFSVEDVRKMHHVHQIATKVLSMSVAHKEEIVKVLKTKDGRTLADIVYSFHVPITDAVWKLTDLQEEFLALSSPSAPLQLNTKNDLETVMGKMLNGS